LVPGSFRWAYCLGTVYDSKNEAGKVIPPLETAVQLQPNSVPALVNLAEACLLTGDAERAASLFQRARDADPACAVASVGLGRIAADRQNFAEAIRHFESALAAQPGATAIHYPLAMAYRQSGDLDQARVHLEQRGDVPAQIDDPLMAELRQLRTGARFYEKHAVAAGKAGQLEIAIGDLRRAVEAEPESASAHLNLGTALALQGDKDAAIEHYRKALHLKPGFARAHYNLAVLLSERGAIREAAENFREAIQIDPHYFDAHLALADLFSRAGRYDRAASYYVRAIAIDPRHRVARLNHAQALIRAGRYTDARASLEEARQILPESMILAHALARLLATCPDAGQRDGARAIDLATAVLQTRKSAEHAETLAMAYAQVGDFEQARLWQMQAMQLASEASPAGLLARLQQNLKRYENGLPPLSRTQ
jgi:tetratricopeptide (TPR) repeat protein